MAPGSKVWSYFVDHHKFGRTFTGPKTALPDKFKATALQTQTPQVAETVDMTNKKATRKKVGKETETTKKDVTTKAGPVKAPADKKATPVTSQAKKRPTGYQLIAVSSSATVNPSTKSTAKKSRTQVEIDTRYAELVQRCTNLRLAGKIDESHIIQAAINVGIMLGWNKNDVLDVVEKMERVVSAEREQRRYSSKMMEVIGEIERFRTNDWSDWRDLKQLRENFKGRFYDGVSDLEAEGSGTKLRAPGFLMLLQAAINVAFLRDLELAKEDGEEFHDGVFDGKVVLLFRVPNKACVEEKEYLMQMSRLGTAKKKSGKVAAYPGIERAIKEDERREVLEKVRDQVDEGRDVIRLATILFGRSTAPATGIGQGESLMQFAMKHLDDEGLLVLEYIYRKRVGFQILAGDQVDNDEEEEEDEEMDNPEADTLGDRSFGNMRIVSDQDEGGEGLHVDIPRRSLVVTLKCRWKEF